MDGYGLILADPPWSYRNGGNGAAYKHYPTMTAADICALPIADMAAPDSVLIMWATWPLLPEAMRVIDAWRFDYITGMPWIKLYDPPMVDLFGDMVARPTYGTGSLVRGASEPILIARRGKVKPPAGSYMGLLSKRLAHSRKPDHIYEYCEQFAGPYLELFARRPRANWDQWGNEIEGIEIDA